MATLFEECLEQLGEQAKVMTEEETIRLFDELQDVVHFTSYGRMDWDAVKRKEVFTAQSIDSLAETRVSILWDNAMFPAVESSLHKVLMVLESVKKVSFDTWIFLPNRYVIEFYHEGESNIAYLE
jgi:hypothetical protein